MRRLYDGGSIKRPGTSQVVVRASPQCLTWMAPVTKHRSFTVPGIWQECRRLDSSRVEQAGGREKPGEVFLVVNNPRQSRRRRLHDS